MIFSKETIPLKIMKLIVILHKRLSCLLDFSVLEKSGTSFKFYLISFLMLFLLQFLISDYDALIIDSLNMEFFVLFSSTSLFLILKKISLQNKKLHKEVMLRFFICGFLFFSIAFLDQNYFFEFQNIELFTGSVVSLYLLLYILQINFLLTSKFVFFKSEMEDQMAKSIVLERIIKIILGVLYFIFFSICFKCLLLAPLSRYLAVAGIVKFLPQLNIYLILFVFFLVFSRPELLSVIKSIKFKTDLVVESLYANSTIWVLSRNTLILNLQDQKLEFNVFKNLHQYIDVIESDIIKDKILDNPIYKLNNLSKDVLIQSSHLKFIFKYHCTMSFSNYKKHIQIKEAVRLLDQNYLVNNTIDSLAFKVGFDSYSPFYTNFKKFTGVNPQDYNSNKSYSSSN